MVSGMLLGPIAPGNGWHHAENIWVQTAHQIGVGMFGYANDNDGNYPDGKSSTEVFQKLLDGGYCSDPTVFYIPLPGKIKPTAGQKLKPENVCWDVTSGVDSSSPDRLPILFMTGYKVTYVPGGSLIPIIKPHPQFGAEIHTLAQWWHEPTPSPGIAVFYKGNNALFLRSGMEISYRDDGSIVLKSSTPAITDGSMANFLPPDFDSRVKTYRQLTPDGLLPGN